MKFISYLYSVKSMLPPTLIHTQKNLKTPTMNMYFYSDYKFLMCLTNHLN